MGRILGIDFGTKRIGLALTDPLRMIASPYDVIQRQSKAADIAAIVRVIDEEKVDALVIGKPYHANGSAGEMVKVVEAFAAEIVAKRPLPVHFVDETYSSIEADELLRQHSKDWRKRKAKVDMVAAQIILRSYLENPT